ncbi:hypothetical protein B0H12DRAFT_1240447 [Mycena haematopus]|nr:hypothetical protein B0H12DRAFT_1240447 [Mycena haematopus]
MAKAMPTATSMPTPTAKTRPWPPHRDDCARDAPPADGAPPARGAAASPFTLSSLALHRHFFPPPALRPSSPSLPPPSWCSLALPRSPITLLSTPPVFVAYPALVRHMSSHQRTLRRWGSALPPLRRPALSSAGARASTGTWTLTASPQNAGERQAPGSQVGILQNWEACGLGLEREITGMGQQGASFDLLRCPSTLTAFALLVPCLRSSRSLPFPLLPPYLPPFTSSSLTPPPALPLRSPPSSLAPSPSPPLPPPALPSFPLPFPSLSLLTERSLL